jgi:large repetitive protein
MRKLLFSLFSTMLFMLSVVGTARAQDDVGPYGKYEVRFTTKAIDCNVSPKKLTIMLQVRATSKADTFRMCNANYRFRYKSTQIRSFFSDPPPVKREPIVNQIIVSQENFSNVAPASDPAYNATTVNGTSEGTTDGLVSVNTIFGGGKQGALVTENWKTVVCIAFEIDPSTNCFQLLWDDNVTFPVTGMTGVYDVTNIGGAFDYKELSVTSGGVFGNLSLCVNDICTPILAKNDINQTPYNTAVSGTVATNDIGTGLSFSKISGPLNGSIIFNANGSYTYTPNATFVGTDIVQYQITDANGKTSTAYLYIEVLPKGVVAGPNNKPVAQPDQSSTNPSTPVSGQVLNNDYDIDGHSLTVTTTPVISPTNGTVVLNANGTYTYTPNAGFTGTDTFDYQVCDNQVPALCDVARVTIYVNPSSTGAGNNNQKPTANADAYITGKGITLTTGNVLLNDSDPNVGQILTVNTTPAAAPLNGIVTLNANGTFTYTPNPTFVGTDVFMYQVCDNGSPQLCSTAPVYITVNAPVSQPPVIGNPATPPTTPEDGGPYTFCMPVTDPDAGDTFTASLCLPAIPASVGTASASIVNGQVCVTFTPAPNFNGSVPVCVKVCDSFGNCVEKNVTINVTNTPDPLVFNPPTQTVIEDSQNNTFCVPYTSADAGNGIAAIATCGNPLNGSYTATSDNANKRICFTFTPVGNYSGPDNICLTITDGNGVPQNVNFPITVTPTPDAPTFTIPNPYNVGSTPQKNCYPIADVDGANDPHTASLCNTPTNGTAVVAIENGQVCVTYTPTNPNASGIDFLCIKVCDTNAPTVCTTQSVNVVITPNNNPPVVSTPSPISTSPGTPKTVCMTVTDPDASSTSFTASLCSVPTKGTATVTVNSSTTPQQVCVTYTPNAGTSGTETLCIKVCDNQNNCTTTNVPVTITSLPVAPVVVVPPFVVPEDSLGTICTPIIDANAGDTHTVTFCGNIKNGTAMAQVVNGQLCITYIPNPNFFGQDSICVRVCDQTGLCTNVKVPVTVVNRNDAPIAIGDINITTVNVTVGGNVLINDSDPDNDPMTVTLVTGTLNGVLILNPNGTYSYKPNPGFTGTDTFKYKVCDNGNPQLCSQATAIIKVVDPTVIPGNQLAPVAINDNTQTPAGLPLVINVKVNDYDPDGGMLGTPTLVSGSGPLHGTLTQNPDGTFVYTPNAGYIGMDSFMYQICNNGIPQKCDIATVTINVVGPNTNPTGGQTNLPPVANVDVKSTIVNTPVSGALTFLAYDPNPGQTLTFSLQSGALHGTVFVNANGTYFYTPAPGYIGSDSFTYKVCDNGTPQMCAVNTVMIVVGNGTMPPGGITTIKPVATDDNAGTQKNTAVVVYVKMNDYITNGGVLTNPVLLAGSGPLNGSVTSNPDGTFTYTPNNGFVGVDYFKYVIYNSANTAQSDTALVTINVVNGSTPPDPNNPAVNSPPVAVDDVVQTYMNTSISYTVAGNDSDPNVGQTLTFMVMSNPLNGSVVMQANGSYVYTPNFNFTGNDVFTYKVCDNGTPQKCTMATAYVQVVKKPNSPPVLGNLASTPQVPSGGKVKICLPITDPDAADIHSVTPCGALNGTTSYTIDNSTTPHQVCVEYTPNVGFAGTDSICVKVCDNAGNCTIKKYPVTVIGTPKPPVIIVQPFFVKEDSTATLCIPIADSDANDTHTVSLCNAPMHGNVSAVVNNSTNPHQLCITYTPVANYYGSDQICIKVCDSYGQCTNVTFPVTIQNVNDPPVAVNDINIASPGVSTTGTVLTNDYDTDGGTLTVTGITTNPTKGIVTINSNGTYVYTPYPGTSGSDTFKYQVCDNGVPSMCTIGTVTINIVDTNPSSTQNNPPVANADVTVTTKGNPVVINVKANDSDPDVGQFLGNPIIVAQGTNGNAVVNPDGTITYTPSPGFVGKDAFSYQICDNGVPQKCSSTLVCVDVKDTAPTTPKNYPPVASHDAYAGNTGNPIVGNVSLNDTDPDGNPLTYALVSNPSNGTVSFNSNGTFTYNPAPGFFGTDTFQYQVCDNGIPKMCSFATVTLTVTNPNGNGGPIINHPPVAIDDYSATPMNTAITILVKSNDYDIDAGSNGVLGLPMMTQFPANGTAIVNANGTIKYTPNSGFVGMDMFKYRVCDGGGLCSEAIVTINVTGSPITTNNPPMATNDSKVGVKNGLISGTVATNDMDPDAGQTLTFTSTSSPANGILFFNSNGTYSYIPNTGFVGVDVFTYKVCDNGSPSLCANATVTLTITDVTAPVGTGNTPPVALVDYAATPRNVAVTINVRANDYDLYGGILGLPIKLTNPLNGSVALNSSGMFVYTPNSGFTGIDTFTYQVCDNGVPSLCASTTVYVTVVAPAGPVLPPNLPPVAIDDAKITAKGTAVSGTVASNDYDPDAGQTISFTKLTNPQNGSVVFNANGSYTYTPNAGFVGNDYFTYKVCDNLGLCTNATVYITVLDKACQEMQLKVLLEGPYNPTVGLMTTVLNQRGLLPGQSPIGGFGVPTAAGQPYAIPPFNYNGTETMVTYPVTVTDWVLVSLRTSTLASSTVLKVAGLLHNDGTVTFVDPCFDIADGDYHVVVEHRNHVGVMSSNKVALTGNKIIFDFTTQDSYSITNPPSFGQKRNTITGKYTMYAGDVNKATKVDNYDINSNDSKVWKGLSGVFDRYMHTDFNLNADTNFQDSALWKVNSGRYSAVDH